MSHIPIPEHGSPAQALAVYEFLEVPLTQVFEQYDHPLGQLFAEQYHADHYRPPSDQYDLLDDPHRSP
jgi:hypothetical protein